MSVDFWDALCFDDLGTLAKEEEKKKENGSGKAHWYSGREEKGTQTWAQLTRYSASKWYTTIPPTRMTAYIVVAVVFSLSSEMKGDRNREQVSLFFPPF